jgi:hypothetical protein
MIVTKLQGGLGNQLFQWAVTRYLSVKYNTDYNFELSYFRLMDWELELNKFKKIKIEEYNKPISLQMVTDNFNFKIIEDNSFLNGYWQSEKYFTEIDSLIREDLKIEDDLMNYIINRYPILNENTVSLHVRRGDYIKKSNWHTIQNIDYYKRAYDIINDNSINILVFSDDINWCKDNFKFDNITYIEGEKNIVDMYIMSLCKHNIIANSSFSWWGAWLNNNENKQVIIPSKWFGISNSHLNTNDLYCDKWIKI